MGGSVSGLDGGDGEFAAVGVSECGEDLGYVGAHGGLAQAEPFGDGLVRQRLDEQVERGAQVVRETLHSVAEGVVSGVVSSGV